MDRFVIICYYSLFVKYKRINKNIKSKIQL